MEFRPLINEIGFRPPAPEDPRERKPKADDPDYSQKLEAHEAFNFERDVYQEISHVRDAGLLLLHPEELSERGDPPQIHGSNT